MRHSLVCTCACSLADVLQNVAPLRFVWNCFRLPRVLAVSVSVGLTLLLIVLVSVFLIESFKELGVEKEKYVNRFKELAEILALFAEEQVNE